MIKTPTLLVLAGLLPGLLIGWSVSGRWASGSTTSTSGSPVSIGQDTGGRPLNRSGSLRESSGRDGRSGPSGIRQQDMAEGSVSRTPLLDLIAGGGDSLDVTEMSSLMIYRLVGEVANLQRGDFPAVMSRAKCGDKWNGDMMSFLFARWAEIDPEAAMAFGNEHLKDQEIAFSGYDESDWRILIAAVDLETNGSQAMTSLEKSLEGVEVEDWWSDHDDDMDLFYLYSVKAAQDPETVWQEIFQGADENLDAEMLVVGLIDGCQKSGKMSWLLEKMESLEQDQRDEMLGGVAMLWTMKDPEAAKQWAEQQAKEGNPEVVGEVAEIWAERFPKEAAEWLLSMADGAGSADLQSQAFGLMVDDDLDRAVTWLKAQDREGGQWVEATEMLVRNLNQNQRYEEAFDWLEELGDEKRKNMVVASLLHQSATPYLAVGRLNEIGELMESRGYGEMYQRFMALNEERQEAAAAVGEIDQKISNYDWANDED